QLSTLRDIVVHFGPPSIGGDSLPKVRQRRAEHRRPGRSGYFLDGLGQRVLVKVADQRMNDFSPLEEQERRKGTDSILSSQVRLLVGIDLADPVLAVGLGGQLIDDWGHALTRAAKGRPEIDDDRDGGFQNLLLKVLARKLLSHVSYSRYWARQESPP